MASRKPQQSVQKRAKYAKARETSTAERDDSKKRRLERGAREQERKGEKEKSKRKRRRERETHLVLVMRLRVRRAYGDRRADGDRRKRADGADGAGAAFAFIHRLKDDKLGLVSVPIATRAASRAGGGAPAGAGERGRRGAGPV